MTLLLCLTCILSLTLMPQFFHIEAFPAGDFQVVALVFHPQDSWIYNR